MTTVATIRAGDRHVAVELTGEATFRVTDPTLGTLEAPSLAALRAKVSKLAKATEESTRVAIPVTLMANSWSGDGNLVDATLVGLHAGNGNVLVQHAGRAAEQLSRSASVYRRMSVAEKAEYARLCKENSEARERLSKFLSSRHVSADVLVRSEIGMKKGSK